MREGKKLAPMNAARVLDLSNRTWEVLSAQVAENAPNMFKRYFCSKLNLRPLHAQESRLFGDNPPMRSYQSVTLIKVRSVALAVVQCTCDTMVHMTFLPQNEVWMFGGYNGLKRFNDTYGLALR